MIHKEVHSTTKKEKEKKQESVPTTFFAFWLILHILWTDALQNLRKLFPGFGNWGSISMNPFGWEILWILKL